MPAFLIARLTKNILVPSNGEEHYEYSKIIFYGEAMLGNWYRLRLYRFKANVLLT